MEDYENIYEDLKYANMRELKNYIFVFLTYKHISERIEYHLNKELLSDNMTFEEAYEDVDYRNYLEMEAYENIGFFLIPQYLFKNIFNGVGYPDFDMLYSTLENLKCALNFSRIGYMIGGIDLFETKKLFPSQNPPPRIYYDYNPSSGIYELLHEINYWTRFTTIKELFDFFLNWYSELGKSFKTKRNSDEFSEFANICVYISKFLTSEERNIKMLKNSGITDKILCKMYENINNFDFQEEVTPLVKRIILMYIIVNYI